MGFREVLLGLPKDPGRGPGPYSMSRLLRKKLDGDALAPCIHGLGSLSPGYAVGCLKTVFSHNKYVVFGLFIS